MNLKRFIILPLLALVAVGCQDGFTAPDLDPVFAKGGKKGPPAEYQFVYAESPGELGSDCWHLPGHYHLFWCGPLGQTGDPTLVLKVVQDGDPVEGGEVTFTRCESVNQRVIMPWTYCGVLLRKGRDKWFEGFPYGAIPVGKGGTVSLTLSGWGAGEGVEAVTGVWGMRWTYDAGDGGKLEADAKWHSLALDDYCDPDYPDCAPKP